MRFYLFSLFYNRGQKKGKNMCQLCFEFSLMSVDANVVGIYFPYNSVESMPIFRNHSKRSSKNKYYNNLLVNKLWFRQKWQWSSQRFGHTSLRSNDVMITCYNLTLWRWICVQKIARFHQEDHLISRFQRQKNKPSSTLIL